MRPVGEGRVDVAGGRPEQRAADGGVDRRDDEGEEAIAGDADAERLGLGRIVADRLEAQAER